MFRCELRKLNRNDGLWHEWKDLLTRMRPELRLFGPEWFSIWSQTIGSEKPWSGSIDVAAVYRQEDGRLCGVLPVGHPKIGLLKINAMIGYYQPWRLILADQSVEFDVGRALGLFLVKLGWRVIQLGPWPQSHEVHQGMLSALNESGVYLQKEGSDPLATVELPETWDQYKADIIGPGFQRKIDYYSRKLQREHEVETRHYRQPSAETTKELLSALSQVEQKSWLINDPRGRPRFVGPVSTTYWTRLTQELLTPNDHLDCWLMRSDGKPISFVFALTAGRTRYVIANSYDEEFTKYRTGSILYREMFCEGYSRGLNRYDFGTKEIHYKSIWGAKYSDNVETYTVGKNQLVGGFIKLRTALKPLLSNPPWRRRSTQSVNPVAEVASNDDSPAS